MADDNPFADDPLVQAAYRAETIQREIAASPAIKAILDACERELGEWMERLVSATSEEETRLARFHVLVCRAIPGFINEAIVEGKVAEETILAQEQVDNHSTIN